jgi:hypothetical protein
MEDEPTIRATDRVPKKDRDCLAAVVASADLGQLVAKNIITMDESFDLMYLHTVDCAGGATTLGRCGKRKACQSPQGEENIALRWSGLVQNVNLVQGDG